MFKDTMTIHTFGPGENAYGQNGGAYEGNLRKGELRGIIHIGCDTCRKFCPTDAIKGGLGAKHEIIDDACLYCGQCLVACPFNAIEQMSFVDEVERVLDAKDRIVVAQPSPAVRVSICEEFGGEPDRANGQRSGSPRLRHVRLQQLCGPDDYRRRHRIREEGAILGTRRTWA